MGDILNSIPLSQLEELKFIADEAKKKKAADTLSGLCLWCEGYIAKLKAGQKFCCTKCRVGYADALQLQYVSRLEREKADWTNERISLIAEIHKYKALAGIP